MHRPPTGARCVLSPWFDPFDGSLCEVRTLLPREAKGCLRGAIVAHEWRQGESFAGCGDIKGGATPMTAPAGRVGDAGMARGPSLAPGPAIAVAVMPVRVLLAVLPQVIAVGVGVARNPSLTGLASGAMVAPE
ncbi:hypothetical protein GCM10010521_63230 [Streptomyces rameus]|uniref:Uncharacterized protein n=1 Tax=Streptomyces rameus TaxID=68261 RepID=A0ABN3V344_9ACTN